MALGTLSQVAIQQFFDNSGRPLAGGRLGFFAAGTPNPLPAFADKDLTVQLPNPVVLDAAGRAPELYMSAASYKQVLQDAFGVTIWTADHIPSAALLAQLAFSPTVTTIALGGAQHNIPTGTTHNKIIFCTNGTDATLTGFADGIDGDVLFVLAAGTGHVFLSPNNAGSNPTARLTNYVTSGPTPLAAGYGTAMYMYIGALQRWKLVSHDQGHAITVPYSSANYVASPGTWTMPAGNVAAHNYTLAGAQLEVGLTLGPSTITGAPNTLTVGGWGYTFGSSVRVPGISSDPVFAGQGPWFPCLAVTDPGTTLYFTTMGYSPWKAQANLLIFAQGRFDVV